jgi:hypothetical protein
MIPNDNSLLVLGRISHACCYWTPRVAWEGDEEALRFAIGYKRRDLEGAFWAQENSAGFVHRSLGSIIEPYGIADLVGTVVRATALSTELRCHPSSATHK